MGGKGGQGDLIGDFLAALVWGHYEQVDFDIVFMFIGAKLAI